MAGLFVIEYDESRTAVLMLQSGGAGDEYEEGRTYVYITLAFFSKMATKVKTGNDKWTEGIRGKREGEDSGC